MEKSTEIPKKQNKTNTPYDAATPLLGIYTNNMKIDTDLLEATAEGGVGRQHAKLLAHMVSSQEFTLETVTLSLAIQCTPRSWGRGCCIGMRT